MCELAKQDNKKDNEAVVNVDTTGGQMQGSFDSTGDDGPPDRKFNLYGNLHLLAQSSDVDH